MIPMIRGSYSWKSFILPSSWKLEMSCLKDFILSAWNIYLVIFDMFHEGGRKGKLQ